MSTPTIRITSKKDGFRRAGVTHTGTTTYPQGTFTPEELAQLQADPILVVDILPEGEALAPLADKTELEAELTSVNAQLAAAHVELGAASEIMQGLIAEKEAAEHAAKAAVEEAATLRAALAEAEAKAKAEAEEKAKATGKGK